MHLKCTFNRGWIWIRGAYPLWIPINNLHLNRHVHFKCPCWSVVVLRSLWKKDISPEWALIRLCTSVWDTQDMELNQFPVHLLKTSDGAYCICASFTWPSRIITHVSNILAHFTAMTDAQSDCARLFCWYKKKLVHQWKSWDWTQWATSGSEKWSQCWSAPKLAFFLTASRGATPLVAEKKSDCKEVYEKMSLLLTWFITSVNMSLWSQSLVSSLLQYSMMFI